jgi:hypothetical protein
MDYQVWIARLTGLLPIIAKIFVVILLITITVLVLRKLSYVYTLTSTKDSVTGNYSTSQDGSCA